MPCFASSVCLSRVPAIAAEDIPSLYSFAFAVTVDISSRDDSGVGTDGESDDGLEGSEGSTGGETSLHWSVVHACGPCLKSSFKETRCFSLEDS